MEQRRPSFFQKHPFLKDSLSLITFIIAVVIGTIILNSFVFRSYNVIGSSMENTLAPNDRIIVNRFAVTIAHLMGQEFTPERGQIIVFANGGNSETLTCEPTPGIKDQYVIKRVIGFAGERVQVKDGVLTVFNDEHPNGFRPDEYTRISDTDGPKSYTSGEIDIIVPEGEIFVSGDNREGSHSYDSRNGLGTVPLCRIVGPAALRLYPFTAIRFF
ncbi:signal peptidase I [Candidatus Saccharibacteria bacterium]|nr:signal peptidase I [Candidatus Saccharibacteria bacterium]